MVKGEGIAVRLHSTRGRFLNILSLAKRQVPSQHTHLQAAAMTNLTTPLPRSTPGIHSSADEDHDLLTLISRNISKPAQFRLKGCPFNDQSFMNTIYFGCHPKGWLDTEDVIQTKGRPSLLWLPQHRNLKNIQRK